jgi:predicted AAA+ superfamily ATPase
MYYKNYIVLDFEKNPELTEIFAENIDIDNIINHIKIFFPSQTIEQKNTLLIFDEIQKCPRARTALKYFHLDNRYDVIATGSLLGVLYRRTGDSVPVGYEHRIEMHPLDFEEFLWALGYDDEKIKSLIGDCLIKFTRIPNFVFDKMDALIREYIVVGGMPEVVVKYIETKDFELVYNKQHEIVADIEEDITKYADTKDIIKIRNVFRNIPVQLARSNKKFKFSGLTQNARPEQYTNSIT